MCIKININVCLKTEKTFILLNFLLKNLLNIYFYTHFYFEIRKCQDLTKDSTVATIQTVAFEERTYQNASRYFWSAFFL